MTNKAREIGGPLNEMLSGQLRPICTSTIISTFVSVANQETLHGFIVS